MIKMKFGLLAILIVAITSHVKAASSELDHTRSAIAGGVSTTATALNLSTVVSVATDDKLNTLPLDVATRLSHFLPPKDQVSLRLMSKTYQSWPYYFAGDTPWSSKAFTKFVNLHGTDAFKTPDSLMVYSPGNALADTAEIGNAAAVALLLPVLLRDDRMLDQDKKEDISDALQSAAQGHLFNRRPQKPWLRHHIEVMRVLWNFQREHPRLSLTQGDISPIWESAACNVETLRFLCTEINPRPTRQQINRIFSLSYVGSVESLIYLLQLPEDLRPNQEIVQKFFERSFYGDPKLALTCLTEACPASIRPSRACVERYCDLMPELKVEEYLDNGVIASASLEAAGAAAPTAAP